MTLKKGFLNQVNLLLHYEIQLWNKLELSAVFLIHLKQGHTLRDVIG